MLHSLTKTTCAAALALAVSAPILAPTAAEAQGARLSESQVLRVRSNGPHCAHIKARKSNIVSFALVNRITRQACFPSRSQCTNWLYWAQTYFNDVRLTRRCS